jgi:hypothetical protein
MTDHYPAPEAMERNIMADVTEIGPLGYGNPDGISFNTYQQMTDSGELPSEMTAKVIELIRSGECLRQVTDDDDGCIDGRPTDAVSFVDSEGRIVTNDVIIDENGARIVHERAKVAGGGYVTALAMRRALEHPKGTIDQDLADVANDLTEQNIYCGSHTGVRDDDAKTGCGANDNCRPILENGLVFREKIADNVGALIGLAGTRRGDNAALRVTDGWAETLNNDTYFEGSTGKSRLNTIDSSIKAAQQRTGSDRPIAVRKHLAGSHAEIGIIVNYVEGHTFSQAAFADALHEAFPDVVREKLPQLFVVDAWRIEQLATAIGSAPKRDAEDSEIARSDEEIQEDIATAREAGYAYQLATAATLTDGSLPAYALQAAA